MTQKSAAADVTCRHCGATAKSVETGQYFQAEPRGGGNNLEVWTCTGCGWRNVSRSTPAEA